jgi:hypothetical protein
MVFSNALALQLVGQSENTLCKRVRLEVLDLI